MAVRAHELRATPALPSPPVPRSRPGVDVVLVVLAAALFLGFASRTISAPFGDSHDGRNAGTWGAGSQNLRENGPINSRLGTRSPEAGVYANHPPLISVETAVAELLGSASPAATRAPAWLGSLLAVWLLARLLRESELVKGAAGTAVVLVATTPMFLVYGTMLDTPVTSLPLGLALLLVWERARRGAVRPALGGVLAALAVLSGWQGLVLAFLIGTWAAVRVVRGWGQGRPELAFPAGALVGLTLLLAWLFWAFDFTLRPLISAFLFRAGESTQPVSLGELFAAHRDYTAALFGVVGLLGLGGLVLALRDKRTRAVATVALGATLPHAIIFKSGAVNHDYWDYWFILPLAIGLAVGADRSLTWWAARGRPLNIALASVALLGTVLAASAWFTPPGAEGLKINGFEAAELLRNSPLSPDQATAWYAGAVVESASWFTLAAARPTVFVKRVDYGSLSTSAPGDIVLVGQMRCEAGVEELRYELRPAASLVDRPPAVEFC